MIRYLCDNGYVESAERLQTESQISLSSVDAADNVSAWKLLSQIRFFELGILIFAMEKTMFFKLLVTTYILSSVNYPYFQVFCVSDIAIVSGRLW